MFATIDHSKYKQTFLVLLDGAKIFAMCKLSLRQVSYLPKPIHPETNMVATNAASFKIRRQDVLIRKLELDLDSFAGLKFM